MAGLLDLIQSLSPTGVARNRMGGVVDSSDTFTGAMGGLANMLGGAARGAVTATLGIPGDINQAIVNNVGSLFPNAPAAPTTAQWQQLLPYQPTSYEGQMAQKMGEFIPITPKVASEAVSPLAKLAGNAINDAMVYGTGPLAKVTPQPMRIFVGENSKNWDKMMGDAAKMMEEKNASPEEIHKVTGTFKGADNQWRQELSDTSAHMKGSGTFENTVMNRMKALGKDQTAEPMTVGDVFHHSSLFDAYPDLKDMEVRFTNSKSNSRGQLARSGDKTWIEINPNLTSDESKSTLLHELQHAIQDKEGFSKGGNPSTMVLTLEDLANQKRQEAQKMFALSSNQDPLNPQIIKPGARAKGLKLEQEARDLEQKTLSAFRSEKAKFDLYQQLHGEAEARATQARMGMTPEQQRASYPYSSYDVDPTKLIVRY